MVKKKQKFFKSLFNIFITKFGWISTNIRKMNWKSGNESQNKVKIKSCRSLSNLKLSLSLIGVKNHRRPLFFILFIFLKCPRLSLSRDYGIQAMRKLECSAHPQ